MGEEKPLSGCREWGGLNSIPGSHPGGREATVKSNPHLLVPPHSMFRPPLRIEGGKSPKEMNS